MEYLFLGFFIAVGELFCVIHIFGIVRVMRYAWLFDILMTIGLPILLLGTGTGALVSVIAGIFFTLFLMVLRPFIKIPPRRSRWFRRDANNNQGPPQPYRRRV